MHIYLIKLIEREGNDKHKIWDSGYFQGVVGGWDNREI